VDPSSPGGYPMAHGTFSGSNTFTMDGTGHVTGIDFGAGSDSELNGVDAIEAFLYSGSTAQQDLCDELGAGTGCTDMGQNNIASRVGDVTDISALTNDLGLIPLDDLQTDPGSLSGLSFSENLPTSSTNIILVGMGEAASVPEPGTVLLLGSGLLLMGLVGASRRRLS
jgi:hypothetical protein